MNIAKCFHSASFKIAALTLILTSTTPAFSRDLGFYVEGYGGVKSASTIDTYIAQFAADTGTDFGISAGLLTPIDGLAFELDLMRSEMDAPSAHFTLTTIMLNAEYSVGLGEMFDIYGGAGLGSLSFLYSEDPGNVAQGLAYQVFAGARVNMTEHVAVFGEYKYATTFSGFEPGTVFRDAHPSHNVLAGLRYSF